MKPGKELQQFIEECYDLIQQNEAQVEKPKREYDPAFALLRYRRSHEQVC